MIRVLLVDDEPLIRLALRELIAWEDFQCEVVAEASDGQEALHLLQNKGDIDLMLMDIQMPGMDGITCLEQLRELPDVQKPTVIVLSAYSEYDYVRQAFLLGAIDYMMKTRMETKPMTVVIAKAVAGIQARMLQAEREEREQRALHTKVVEASWTAQLRGTSTQDEISIGESDAQGEQIIACVHIGASNQATTYTVPMIRQSLEGYFTQLTVLPITEQEYALMIYFGEEAAQGRHHIRNRLAEGMERIISHLKQYVNQGVSIGVSDFIQSRHEWRTAYEQAQQLAELRFFTREGRVFFPEHAALNRAQLQALGTETWNRKDLFRCIETGQPWKEELEKGFGYWRSMQTKPMKDIQKMYHGFLWELGALLHARECDWPEVLGHHEAPYETLLALTSMADVHFWLEGLVGKLAAHLDPRRLAIQQSPRLIDKAKAYINAHYHEPLSLGDVSEWVGVTESHLSKQFVKETGENFIAYVTQIRIEKAIQLMWGGMKLFEIAERVGYPNQGHFSRMFKKVTGQTPQQYRESCKLE
ncbi:response regulator [Paenibacillus roseipurpureus]|uniref:Response regulator n=1 Tax=Paenibacillus roseopurpureus TaxID=2918901 RepID=A0AA96RKF4_9BACL|nr:response regulator [Paenibacillus sp. MBLB1832]WNR46293.1 response regulator [Paenibacillus sp. MBLB1832]